MAPNLTEHGNMYSEPFGIGRSIRQTDNSNVFLGEILIIGCDENYMGLIDQNCRYPNTL